MEIITETECKKVIKTRFVSLNLEQHWIKHGKAVMSQRRSCYWKQMNEKLCDLVVMHISTQDYGGCKACKI
jgi:hypothetical protein